MIQNLNKIINFIFKGLMYITHTFAFIFWLVLLPFLFIHFKLRKDKMALNHPNLVYVRYAMCVDKFYKRFIF